MHIFGFFVLYAIVKAVMNRNRNDLEKEVSPGLILVLVWVALLALVTFAVFLTRARHPLALLLWPLALILLFPYATARWILVPLGWVQACKILGPFSLFFFRKDKAGAGFFLAFLASQNHKDPQGQAQNLAKLLAKKRFFKGAEVMAWAYWCHLRGDREMAVQLFRAALGARHAEHIPFPSRLFAVKYLLAHFAEAEDWEQVLDVIQAGRVQVPTIVFFKHLAKMKLGKKVNPLWVQVSATLSGNRELLAYCFAPDSEQMNEESGDIGDIAELLANPFAGKQAINRAALLLETHLESAQTQAWLDQRRVELGVDDAFSLAEAVAPVWYGSVGSLLTRKGPLPEEPSLWLESVLELELDRAFEDFEQLLDSVKGQPSEEDDASTNWLIWARVQAVFRLLAHDAYNRSAASRMFLSDGWNWAARMWNDRGDRLLPNTIFYFLADEADALGLLAERAKLLQNANQEF
ncbi:MAG: hypothetical protein H6510_02640 [Acidobacteria bacterium]|nr:hypothetical protein [Acidobacteriota bacterium]MCB9396693.1 hypothetical protein [Acidobacteriota bacterium]